MYVQNPAMFRFGGTQSNPAYRTGAILILPGDEIVVCSATLVPNLPQVTKCKALGARVIQHGDDIGEAKALADEVYVKGEGLRYVNGFDHPHIIAGQVSKESTNLNRSFETFAQLTRLNGSAELGFLLRKKR